MGYGEVSEWSVRRASCEQILRSIPLADCDGRVIGKPPFEMAL